MSEDRAELLGQLHELARLELDLVVRDLAGEAAFQALVALHAEIQVILDRTTALRSRQREQLATLEKKLEASWGGQGAVEVLMALAEARRDLAELDSATGPSQVLNEELQRRTARSGDQS